MAALNYRERMKAGLYSSDENVRAKAEKALSKEVAKQVAEVEAEQAEAEDVNAQRIEAANE